MARFDVYRLRRRGGFIVDCQSHLNSMMTTRVVVPLLPIEVLCPINARMNPVFTIEGRDYVLAVQGLQSVPVTILGEHITSLLDYDTTITAAIDALMSGI